MANIVGSEKEAFSQGVYIKYIPIADNYKGYALPASITTGTGKHCAVKLKPGVRTKVPVEMARMLVDNVKKSKRRNMVPDGDRLESDMVSDQHRERDEASPDYEIVVEGNI